MAKHDLEFQWLGLCDYEVALQKQHQLYLKSFELQQSFVLGLEHPPVVTIGRRCRTEDQLRVDKQKLLNLGWKILSVDRGGQATVHMPGQLVIYPIVNLRHLGLGVHEYLCKLVKTTSRLLKMYQVETTYSETDPGLYTQYGKICFFGIRVQKGVAYHGLSLNVHNDISGFEFIRPCGVEKRNLDSLHLRSINASCHELFHQWVEVFQQEFLSEVCISDKSSS